MLVPGVVLSVNKTEVFKQIWLFEGFAVISAIGLDWIFIGPIALELLPHGFVTVTDAWNELG